jgi:hypothetical protein
MSVPYVPRINSIAQNMQLNWMCRKSQKSRVEWIQHRWGREVPVGFERAAATRTIIYFLHLLFRLFCSFAELKDRARRRMFFITCFSGGTLICLKGRIVPYNVWPKCQKGWNWQPCTYSFLSLRAQNLRRYAVLVTDRAGFFSHLTVCCRQLKQLPSKHKLF